LQSPEQQQPTYRKPEVQNVSDFDDKDDTNIEHVKNLYKWAFRTSKLLQLFINLRMHKKKQCNYKICALASDNEIQLMVHPQDKPAAIKKPSDRECKSCTSSLICSTTFLSRIQERSTI
jgi:hypothetical protein